MTYTLHCFGQSGNAYKVALYLECAGLDWRPAHVGFFAGETRGADWRASNNAMGEAPVLETPDGRKLSQSGAILTYLSDVSGKFVPSDKYEALRWMLFDNHKFTSYFATYRFNKSFGPAPMSADVEQFLRGRIEANFGIVDQHLRDRAFVLGDVPSIADFSLIGYVFYPKEESGFDIAALWPNIFAWSERMRALPGWKHPYDLMPGERVAPKW
jgi:glutathione S-transferase